MSVVSAIQIKKNDKIEAHLNGRDRREKAIVIKHVETCHSNPFMIHLNQQCFDTRFVTFHKTN